MNNNFVKIFLCFLDKWGILVSFLLSIFIFFDLDIFLGIKRTATLGWSILCFQIASIIRYFYVYTISYIEKINKKLNQNKQQETLVLDLAGYIKICDKKEVDLYYGPLIRMVVNDDINICYDGQMDYSFFTSNNSLFIAVYDSKENCLFINSGYKKMIDDNKTKG